MLIFRDRLRGNADDQEAPGPVGGRWYFQKFVDITERTLGMAGIALLKLAGHRSIGCRAGPGTV